MKRMKVVFISLAILIAALAIFFVLVSDKALLTHPKGMIARKELKLMVTNILLMFVVVIPAYILLFLTAWKYRAKSQSAKHQPNYSLSRFKECILWMIPSLVVLVMAIITYHATHELDPYKALKNKGKSLKIQVVALDWKWLFIYPEHDIATVNFVQFPKETPIHFELAADDSPMNSFWIPQLSGQIYAMSGMVTPLPIIADEIGSFVGRAAEINGEGFADMTFIAKATSESDFDLWVKDVKQSQFQLTDSVYQELVKRSINHPVILYSSVKNDLFNQVVMKYMHP